MGYQYKNFGEFLHQKRLAKGDSYRDLAAVLNVSAPYISDIEKDITPSRSVTLKKSAVPPDLPDYIKGNDFVAAALRTARDYGATERDWQDFVEELKRRKGDL